MEKTSGEELGLRPVIPAFGRWGAGDSGVQG